MAVTQRLQRSRCFDEARGVGEGDEAEQIRRFYRERFLPQNAWWPILPHAYLCQRQRQRRIRQCLQEIGAGSFEDLRKLRVLEVGCGGGSNLAWLVEMGADPTELVGIDLVPERIEQARQRCAGVRFLAGNILETDVGGPFDVVMLFAVLTSVTNAETKQKIVERCLSLLRPGGALLFYDLMTRREDPGTPNYKKLTYAEFEGYLGGRRPRYFKRDYLRRDVAERIVPLPRVGLFAAEVLQAIGWFNIEATFAHVRV
ncbi:class I SAM-dependent methyltransferase [Polyangium jinanense]|uniref:Class I SAM-dependent methyltransferase n=1 Tax=Polyangium jinanense TaxID=2829994 RepID=A0A9X3X642_9BACT|nr:class I SAM-dependent methyltransferase [Polyangium jinanense]